MRHEKSLWKEILLQFLNLCLVTIFSLVIATVAALPIYGILGIGQTNEVNLVYAILGILAEAALPIAAFITGEARRLERRIFPLASRMRRASSFPP